MKILRKISPAFLNAFDDKLRSRSPWLWATRIHYHIYISLMCTAFFTLIGAIYRVNLTDVPSRMDQGVFWAVLIVPCIILSLYMLYNMSLFNPDKAGAKRIPYQEFFVLIIYLVTFLMPFAIPYSATWMLDTRTDWLVDDQELYEDAHNLTYADPFLYTGWGEYRYYPSDSIYLEFRKKPELKTNYYDDEVIITPHDSLLWTLYWTNEHHWSQMRDSILYQVGVFEEDRPHLYFHGGYLDFLGYSHYHGWYYETPIFSDSRDSGADSLYQIFVETVNVARSAELAKPYLEKYAGLLEKYGSDTLDVDRGSLLEDYLQNRYTGGYVHYYLDDADDQSRDNIENLFDAKENRSVIYDDDTFYGTLVFCFCFAVLFSIFKNVHWRQGLLFIATTSLLITLIAVIGVIVDGDEEYFLSAFTFLPFLFLAISFWGFKLKTFNGFLNQVVMLLNISLPWILIMILVYLDEVHDIFRMPYFDQYKVWYYPEFEKAYLDYSSEYYELISRIWWVVIWGSPIMYILAWNSYVKSLYQRFWFLPRRR